jgi:Flp pilus assembly pilin Flp
VSATILTAKLWLSRLHERIRGQGLVEYVLILALVAVVAIVSLTGLGQTIVTKLYTLSNSL